MIIFISVFGVIGYYFKSQLEKKQNKREENLELEHHYMKNIRKNVSKIEQSKTLKTKLSYAHKVLDDYLELQELLPNHFISSKKEWADNIQIMRNGIKVLPIDDLIQKSNQSEGKGDDKLTLKHLSSALRIIDKEDIRDSDFKSIYKNNNQWKGIVRSLTQRAKDLGWESTRSSKKIVIRYTRDLSESSQPIIKHRSEDTGKTYTINTKTSSCSCPDFQKWRTEYETKDIKRYCKHMKKTLFDMFPNTTIETYNELLDEFLTTTYPKSGPRHNNESFYHFEIEGNDVLVLVNTRYDNSFDFYTVLTKEIINDGGTLIVGDVCEYSFNLYQNSWDDEIPHNSKKIRDILMKEMPRDHFDYNN